MVARTLIRNFFIRNFGSFYFIVLPTSKNGFHLVVQDGYILAKNKKKGMKKGKNPLFKETPQK